MNCANLLLQKDTLKFLWQLWFPIIWLVDDLIVQQHEVLNSGNSFYPIVLQELLEMLFDTENFPTTSKPIPASSGDNFDIIWANVTQYIGIDIFYYQVQSFIQTNLIYFDLIISPKYLLIV